MYRNALSIVLSLLVSGCALNRLAYPEEPFILSDDALRPSKVLLVDARPPIEKQSRNIEDGFFAGDNLFLPNPVDYIQQELTKIATTRGDDLTLRVLGDGQEVKLIKLEVRVEKSPSTSAVSGKYNYAPPGQAAFNTMMDSFVDEMSRLKLIKINLILDVQGKRYLADAAGLYDVVPSNTAMTDPFRRTVLEIYEKIARGAAQSSN